MKSKFLGVMLALVSIKSFADNITIVPDPLVAEVKKDEKAPFSGILFGYEEERQIRLESQQLVLIKQQVSFLETENELLGKKVKLWMDKSEELSKSVIDGYKDNYLKNTAFFVLGTIATIAMAYAIKGAAN